MRTIEWLEHRFMLFDRYCLPSIKSQTCQNFKWIVLFDSTTPEKFKKKITDYQQKCPQLVPVYVAPVNGHMFAEIFREEVSRQLTQVYEPTHEPGRIRRVLTTYLDNDDAINVRFVEDIQSRARQLAIGTFIFYVAGYQFLGDYQYLMRINYIRNHFVSVVEQYNASTVRTIYGYGSHYYIDKIKDARIEYIRNNPMWCEVIHEKNMGNDAYFLGARMVREKGLLREDFGLQEPVRYSAGLYMFRFLPRYCKTLVRRIGYVLFGRHW